MESSSESSDDINETIVENVFEQYSKHGYLTKEQFSSIIIKLSKYVSELEGVAIEQAEAAFDLFSDKHHMNLAQFKLWWRSSDKFSYFVGRKAKPLMKAYGLYKKYSSLSQSTEIVGARKMTIKEFSKMLSDLGIEDEDDAFDVLDTDGDGVLSFKEFCTWLKWF